MHGFFFVLTREFLSVIGGAGKGSIRTSSTPKSKHLPALVPSPVPAREDVVPNPEVDEALALLFITPLPPLLFKFRPRRCRFRLSPLITPTSCPSSSSSSSESWSLVASEVASESIKKRMMSGNKYLN